MQLIEVFVRASFGYIVFAVILYVWLLAWRGGRGAGPYKMLCLFSTCHDDIVIT